MEPIRRLYIPIDKFEKYTSVFDNTLDNIKYHSSFSDHQNSLLHDGTGMRKMKSFAFVK